MSNGRCKSEGRLRQEAMVLGHGANVFQGHILSLPRSLPPSHSPHTGAEEALGQMPDGKVVGSLDLPVFTTAEEEGITAPKEGSGGAQNALSQEGHSGRGEDGGMNLPNVAEETPKPFILNEGLLPIPAKLVGRIVRGEFIDMAELLRDNLEAQGEGQCRSQGHSLIGRRNGLSPQGGTRPPQLGTVLWHVHSSGWEQVAGVCESYWPTKPSLFERRGGVEGEAGCLMTPTFASRWSGSGRARSGRGSTRTSFHRRSWHLAVPSEYTARSQTIERRSAP